MQALRAVIKYPGAKWRIADWIINHMPEHKSYVEPFLGSGAVFFRKPASRIETINDIDKKVINVFRCIREDPEKVAFLVSTTPYSRLEYYKAFNSEGNDPFENARLFLLQTWQGHGFRICYKSGWKNDIAGREYAYAVKYWNKLPEWVLQIVDRLKQAQIECCDAISLIKRFNRDNVLIYADPPYVLNTRKMKKQYANEMSDDEHVKLLKALLIHKGPVLLSGYDNILYRSYLKDWDRYQIKTTAEKGLSRIETLWVKRSTLLCS